MGRFQLGEQNEESKRLRNGDDYCCRSMFRDASVNVFLVTPRREVAFETTIIVAMIVIYAINKNTPFFDNILPFHIASSYLNDICAGILFPAYTNILCIIARSSWRITSLFSVFALGILCSFVWEVVSPAIVPYSVGDPLDCVCYIAGGLIYIALRHVLISKC